MIHHVIFLFARIINYLIGKRSLLERIDRLDRKLREVTRERDEAESAVSDIIHCDPGDYPEEVWSTKNEHWQKIVKRSEMRRVRKNRAARYD